MSINDPNSNNYDINKFKGQSILSDDFEESSSILYRPKTQETRQNYEIILSFIQEYIGDQPRDILSGAADEIIIILKNDRLKDKERKKEVEYLLGHLADEKFSQLVNLSKKLTDWSNEHIQSMNANLNNRDDDENIDETIGVKVMIEEEEEDTDDDNNAYEIDDNERDEDEDEEGDDGEKNIIIQGKVRHWFLNLIKRLA